MFYTFRRQYFFILCLAFGLILFSPRPGRGEGPDERVELKSAADAGEAIWGPHSRQKIYMSLDDCIQRALIFNREIQASKYDKQRAEARYREADIIGRPVLDYKYLLGPAPRDVSNALEDFFTGQVTAAQQFKLNMGIPLTTFGKISTAKQLATTGVDVTEQEKVKKSSEVVFKVKQLYYGILLAREGGRLLNYAYEQASKQIDKREEEGGSDPVELLKLKIFRSEISKQLQEAQRKEILALEAIRVLLGLDRAQSFDIKKSRLRPIDRELKDFDYYYGLAYQQRADIKLLQLGLQAARQQVQIEKKGYLPNLGIGGFFDVGFAPGVTGVTTTDDFSDPFNFTRAGVGFLLEGKFDYGTRQAKVAQARADMYKAETKADMAVDGILLDVKTAYLDVVSAREELLRAEEAGKLARQVLFLTQSNFDIGIAEPRDLIDGIEQFLRTRTDYFKAVFNYNVAFAALDQKIDELPGVAS